MATGKTLAAMLPIMLMLMLINCCTADASPVKTSDAAELEIDFHRIIGGIIESLLKPLKNLLAKQVNSIIQSIIDQGGHIAEQVQSKIAAFVELIRPFVIRIIDKINDIVGHGVELKERIRMAVESVFEFLGVITEANKKIVNRLIQYITDLLFSKISLHNFLMETHAAELSAEDREVEFLIGGILEILMRPLKNLLANQVNSIIQSIIDQGGHIAEQVQSKIAAFVELIRPFVIRIIDKINDIVGHGVELKERIRMAVESVFEYLNVINEANKEIVRQLIHYIADKLLGSRADTQLASVAFQSPKFINGLIDWLVKPIVELVRRQLNALLLMLLDQTDHVTDKLLEHVDVIAELIRPSVIRIIDLTGNLHGEVDNLWNQVNSAVKRIFGNLGAIANESADLVSALIEKVTDAIVKMIQGQPLAIMAEQYLIIDRIIARILQPLLNKINELLDRIREASAEATEEAKQRLLRLINELSLVLKAPIVRIIGILGDLGVEIGDTVSAIRRTLLLIVDSVTGIHEENKKMFKAILESVLQSLLEMVQTQLADKLNYSILLDIINRLLAPFVAKINEMLDRLREELEESIDNVNEIIGKYVERLANLLAPIVAQIVRIMKQLGLAGRDLVENVRLTLQMVIDNVSGIAEANRELLKRLVGRLISAIVDIVRE